MQFQRKYIVLIALCLVLLVVAIYLLLFRAPWSPNQKNSNKQIDLLLEQVEEKVFHNPDLAFQLAAESLSQSEEMEYTLGKAKSRYWLALLLVRSNREGEAMVRASSYAEISHYLFRREIGDLYWIARSMDLLAIVYHDQKRMGEAKKVLRDAKELITDIQNRPIDSLNVLAEVNNTEGYIRLVTDASDDLAGQCFEESIQHYKLLQDSFHQNVSEVLARSLRNLGIYYAKNNDLIFALEKTEEALQEIKKVESKEELARCLYFLGRINIKLFERDPFGSYYYKDGIDALQLALEQNPKQQSDIYLWIAVANRIQQTRKGLQHNSHVIDSLKLAIEKANNEFDLSTLIEIKEELNRPYYLKKDINSTTLLSNCLEAYHAVAEQTKQLSFQEAQRFADFEMNQLTSQFEFAEKKYLFMVISAILIFGLLTYLIFLYKENQKLNAANQALKEKDSARRAQLDTHFISNVLNSIDGLVNMNENLKASRYIVRFGRLCRLFIEASRSDQIQLKEEMQLLEDYLCLEKLRYNEHLNFSINFDDHLDKESSYIPPMILQPLLENAVIHGIRHKTEPGTIEVNLVKKSEAVLSCTVKDDGVGREKAKELEKRRPIKSKSVGLQVILERLDLFRKNLPLSHLEIEDLYDDQRKPIGTSVKVDIPLFTNHEI